MFEKLKEASNFLTPYSNSPKIGVVLGSGLGNFIQEIKVHKEIDYENIPHFPVATVEGHVVNSYLGPLPEKKLLLWLAGSIFMKAILRRSGVPNSRIEISGRTNVVYFQCSRGSGSNA